MGTLRRRSAASLLLWRRLRLNGRQGEPQVEFSGAEYLTAWSDFRGGPPGMVYIAQLTAAGAVIGGPGGTPVANSLSPSGVALGWIRDRFALVWAEIPTQPGVASGALEGQWVSPNGSTANIYGGTSLSGLPGPLPLQLRFPAIARSTDGALLRWARLNGSIPTDGSLQGVRLYPEL